MNCPQSYKWYTFIICSIVLLLLASGFIDDAYADAGTRRKGPSEATPPPLDCEERAKQLRDEYRTTGGTGELKLRWDNLRFECAKQGLDIDVIEGDQPPSKMSPDEATKRAWSAIDPGSRSEDWLGNAAIFLFAIGIVVASVTMIPKLVKFLAADTKRGGSGGGTGGPSKTTGGPSKTTGGPSETEYESADDPWKGKSDGYYDDDGQWHDN